ncbi:beta-lactamase family protein [Flavobacterium sp. TR2]|uniref:serine hydrolase domain-containing protein n=1 Tax=Flavobacterium sp. TR2 TaxID=2977321 RepID=UPI0021B11AD5|nr:serine hydrolase domain-containing protein [Flavobacterium sp. TR2]UWY27367.1 beta-lactamase family protein [Flavobacterium sp. TR2]
MKKFLLTLSLILCIVMAYSQKSAIPADNKLQTKLDSLVNKSAIPFMSESSRVGLSIGIIKDGKEYFYNYGSTQKEKQILPTASTIYELASNSKTFSSTLLARAVLNKKVNLTDDIRKYLNQDYPNLQYNGTPITLLNLANLTSALPNWMPDSRELFAKANPDSIAYLLDAVHRKYSRNQFYTDLHKVKLDTIPGALARHCNTAAQLLGHIMETVYGEKFGTLIRNQFTTPLKMKNTVLLGNGKIPASMAFGYDAKGRKMPFIDWEDIQVAASIASSTSDMLKYIKYHLNEKNEDAKLSHQPTTGDIRKGAIALNWKITKPENGPIRISHTGGSLGFSSYVVFSPEMNSGIILFANDSDMKTQNELIKLAEMILY